MHIIYWIESSSHREAIRRKNDRCYIWSECAHDSSENASHLSCCLIEVIWLYLSSHSIFLFIHSFVCMLLGSMQVVHLLFGAAYAFYILRNILFWSHFHSCCCWWWLRCACVCLCAIRMGIVHSRRVWNERNFSDAHYSVFLFFFLVCELPIFLYSAHSIRCFTFLYSPFLLIFLRLCVSAVLCLLWI